MSAEIETKATEGRNLRVLAVQAHTDKKKIGRLLKQEHEKRKIDS